MKVIVADKGVELERNATAADALRTAGLNPENFLVKRGEKLIPHDEPLKEGDILDLVTVISGG